MALGEDVPALVGLFDRSDLTELELEQRGRKLFLRKGALSSAAAAAEPEPAVEPAQALVKAHLVGIFHWTRDKAKKPVLALQQRIDKGQVAGFVESMGIMNEVVAAEGGVVVEIAVAEGQPVEYGQTLVVLEPD